MGAPKGSASESKAHSGVTIRKSHPEFSAVVLFQQVGCKITNRALTFAYDCGWLWVLNTAVVLIQFIEAGHETCSLSRLGTHCLENFFGLVRQSSRGDDQYTAAIRIIRQATVMMGVMHEMDLHPSIHGRDNVAGTIIGKSAGSFCQERVDLFLHSFIAHASLHLEVAGPSDVIDQAELIDILSECCEKDDHHKKDPGHKADFAGSTTGHGIAAGNHRRATSGDSAEPL
jgi:hypothetical protein